MSNTEVEGQRALRAAVDRLKSQNDCGAIPAVLQQYPDLGRVCDHGFPHLHRVMDFECSSSCYRLSRCTKCGERLALEEILRVTETPGVPLWLTGPGLDYWVRREDKQPSEGPIDWDALKKDLETIPIPHLEERDERARVEGEKFLRDLLHSEGEPGDPFIPIDP